MPTDTPFEQRVRSLYAVSVPAELDRRIERAMATVPVRRPGRGRPRLLAALAVAAIFAITAAGPAIEWFEGWKDPFDRLWEISTPVDQTVTADGYRVTAHRAYADRLGVRLAMTVEDLEDRWSGFSIDTAHATDGDGRVYEGWNGSGSRTPVDGSIATWLRFLLPADALGDDLHLRVTITSLLVRSPDPTELDPARIWTTVGGEWTFELDVPPFTLGESVSPAATATANGVTISLKEIGIVPSGTVVRLTVDGLPELPADSADGWYPVTSVEHDGERHTDDALPPGLVGSDGGDVTLEVVPVVEDLAGHWKITVLEFWSTAREPFGESLGPWVLEFDVAETPQLVRLIDALADPVRPAGAQALASPRQHRQHGTTTVVEIDVRPSGTWRYISSAADRDDVEGVGPMGGPETHILDEVDGETKLTWIGHMGSIDVLEGALETGMVGGAIETWDRLEALLAEH